MRLDAVTLTGPKIVVAVSAGRLILKDRHSEVCLPRHQRTVRRVVIIGHGGYVSLQAMIWMQATGIRLLVLDHHGEPMLTSSDSAGDGRHARLRRAQVTTGGVDAARYLLGMKVERQAENAEWLGQPKVAGFLRALSARCREAVSVSAARKVESGAGGRYWRVVAAQPVRWSWRATPEHWQSFGRRWSPLVDDSPHRAVTFGQTLVNYGYGVLAAEAQVVIHAAGLDPGVGIIHADLSSRKVTRPGLVFDVVEPSRPLVDRAVLSWVAGETFARGDALEAPDGSVILGSRVKKAIAGLALQASGGDLRVSVRHLTNLLTDAQRDPRYRLT